MIIMCSYMYVNVTKALHLLSINMHIVYIANRDWTMCASGYLQEVKNNENFLNCQPQKVVAFTYIGDGCVWEFPSVNLWLWKIWCCGYDIDGHLSEVWVTNKRWWHWLKFDCITNLTSIDRLQRFSTHYVFCESHQDLLEWRKCQGKAGWYGMLAILVGKLQDHCFQNTLELVVRLNQSFVNVCALFLLLW